ncbi:Zinc finger and BTB domain-containing protein 16-A [Orchesella cincta]|uniref:Zinc finger and BTB domain-containing protein 16-A n=1 Tax=Orchesella cincta TaxID=48709 RepID=A0A1D2MH01_ORCCI|nr:Zinc finger and BTB domain-containing protein 16-A [Orchesella cincta]
MTMTSCLFCTSSSPPPAQPSPLVFQGDSVINEQLKAILVLKHILKIPQETLRRFLQQNNGQFNPEIWLNLCSSCADSVHQFLETLKQISRLEKKLNGIETELKLKMQNSKEVASGSPVAEQIRTCVLYGYSIPETSFEVTENPELQLDDDDDNDDQIHSKFLLEPTSPMDIKQEFEVHQESVATFAVDILSSSPPHDHYSSLFLDPDDMDYETPPATSPPQQLNPQRKRRTIKLQDGNYSYSCEQCPYGSTNIHRYRLHLKNHEPGSKAVVCPKCGWYVMRIGAHNGKAHSRTSDKVGGKKVRRFTYYKCAECQALLGRLDDYKEHEILHENGNLHAVWMALSKDMESQ